MKYGFKGTTVLERIDEKYFRLKEPLAFHGKNISVKVDPEFVTDGASIPRPLWMLVGCPFSGKYVQCAIIHDALYNSHSVKQKDADSLFNEMMKHKNVFVLRRLAMYYTLKFLGAFSYKSKRPAHIKVNKALVKVIRNNR